MSAPHIPVLLDEVMAALAPRSGERMIDGTFGAGGYSRAILAAGARVLGIDRDPESVKAAPALEGLTVAQGVYSDMERIAAAMGFAPADGVVLDIGVSSMQIDRPERGFSFQKDGPLDMRMGAEGPSAADFVNRAGERVLADVIFRFGEERRSRAIAKAIVSARKESPVRTTAELVAIVERAVGRGRPGEIHPATRTFQALRILVNDELGELARGLVAAERLLAPHGRLAVVTFHSLEDRIVKVFLADRCGRAAGPSRHAPEIARPAASFEPITKGAVEASEAEIARNPRARSAKLRAARRTAAPAFKTAWTDLPLPLLADEAWT